MKKINIQCYDNGRATLKTKDIHIESENIASIIEVDFSQVEYKDYQKGLDIESGSYLLRYFFYKLFKCFYIYDFYILQLIFLYMFIF